VPTLCRGSAVLCARGGGRLGCAGPLPPPGRLCTATLPSTPPDGRWRRNAWTKSSSGRLRAGGTDGASRDNDYFTSAALPPLSGTSCDYLAWRGVAYLCARLLLPPHVALATSLPRPALAICCPRAPSLPICDASLTVCGWRRDGAGRWRLEGKDAVPARLLPTGAPCTLCLHTPLLLSPSGHGVAFCSLPAPTAHRPTFCRRPLLRRRAAPARLCLYLKYGYLSIPSPLCLPCGLSPYARHHTLQRASVAYTAGGAHPPAFTSARYVLCACWHRLSVDGLRSRAWFTVRPHAYAGKAAHLNRGAPRLFTRASQKLHLRKNPCWLLSADGGTAAETTLPLRVRFLRKRRMQLEHWRTRFCAYATWLGRALHWTGGGWR